MDPLRQAIRHEIERAQALAANAAAQQASKPLRRAHGKETVAQIAEEALAFIEAARDGLPSGDYARVERVAVTGALLAYGLDIAWSICHLLRTEPERTHIVVLTLWRPLVETWLRAVFFAIEATDDELSAFRARDELPKRAWPSKPQKLHDIKTSLIAKLVSSAICPDAPELIQGLADELTEWHGFVHGGEIVVTLFDNNGTFRSQVGPDHMGLKVQRVAVMGFLIGLTGLVVSAQHRPREELEPTAARLHALITAFQERWQAYTDDG
ncbi:hypothetical protein GUR46_18630 [Stenotrophomonas maltophilia]|uniref:hypothetical protein n=1 Tax=Stenotrophomonas maltophilia TaxID=40324 RepID=UPI001F1D3DAC|nr:hypothetical protein [Stenotrophomonas maltophilia]MCF3530892.1 hypothetical protein [Stenotrophomonas maltophilia]MCF3534776.1 hypothetical protein [Stenotrophomonas maltophilia]